MRENEGRPSPRRLYPSAMREAARCLACVMKERGSARLISPRCGHNSSSDSTLMTVLLADVKKQRLGAIPSDPALPVSFPPRSPELRQLKLLAGPAATPSSARQVTLHDANRTHVSFPLDHSSPHALDGVPLDTSVSNATPLGLDSLLFGLGRASSSGWPHATIGAGQNWRLDRKSVV